MTKSYWIRGGGDDYARVDGADQRDWWSIYGWVPGDEPTGQEFVWARHEGIAEPARFPAAILASAWPGWEPSAPPFPVNPLTGEPIEPPEPDVVKSSKPAPSGDARKE